MWETEWPEEWYIEDDCDWSNTHLCLVVPRDPDSRPFLQSYVRGLEILLMTVYYDVFNCIPAHPGACFVTVTLLSSSDPEGQIWHFEAYHNRVAQLPWEWLWHVKPHLGLAFELRRMNFNGATRELQRGHAAARWRATNSRRVARRPGTPPRRPVASLF